jgi:dihydroxy-acid dehydratase
MVGHISPEAARGGPIALLEDGDRIVIDVEQRVIDTDADLASRPKREWPISPEATGAFAKYAALVGSASEGAVTLPG